jgi:hypothetical protein
MFGLNILKESVTNVYMPHLVFCYTTCVSIEAL